ncbi:MAG TPA: MFS transporter [Burkholderiaceae bacterium]
MAFFSRSALNPGVAPREVFGWAMYDFANSGFTTVVLTAVFNAYFVGAVAGNASWATLAWTLALAASSLLVMFTAPAIGAYADAHGAKKRLLLLSTAGCVIGTAALAFAQPGTVAIAVVAVIAANYFYSVGESLIAAFLPEISKHDALGKVSGWGWSFGYFGGMLTLGLCLWVVIGSQAAGKPASEFVPLTMLVTAGVFAIAAIPTFVLLRERSDPERAKLERHGRTALERLRHTWNESSRFRDFRLLLACGCAYQAGISVVIALAAVYAEQVMGFKQAQTMMLVFLVNIASALGAFGFGYVQDRVGHKRALAITLWGWILMVALASLGTSVQVFWLAATVAGLCMGSSQSCGRAMVGSMTPPERLAEFYGLWGFATRLAAIIGPVTYGVVTFVTTGNHRLAIGVTGLFFVVALLILRTSDTARGVAARNPAAAG